MMVLENDLITPVGQRRDDTLEAVETVPQKPWGDDPFANDPFDDEEDDAEPLWGTKPESFDAFLARLNARPTGDALIVPPRFVPAMRKRLGLPKLRRSA